MLSRNHKLNTQAFSKVFRSGKRQFSDHFQYIVAPAETFRAAAVISKKNYTKAVQRNSARRTIFRALQKLLPELPPMGVIILLKKGANIPEYETAIKEIKKTLVDH